MSNTRTVIARFESDGGDDDSCAKCTPSRMCIHHAIEHNTGKTGIVFFPAPISLDSEEN